VNVWQVSLANVRSLSTRLKSCDRKGWVNDDILAVVFKSVVLVKILYASPAWFGFANSSDKQRLKAFLRRCIRFHLYRQSDPTVTQLVEDMEDKVFTNVLNNHLHVLLIHILPDHNNHTYNLRPRRHEPALAVKGDARNFFERQLFKDTYWLFLSSICCYYLTFICQLISFMYGCVLSAEFYTLNWTELNRASTTCFTTSSYLTVWPLANRGGEDDRGVVDRRSQTIRDLLCTVDVVISKHSCETASATENTITSSVVWCALEINSETVAGNATKLPFMSAQIYIISET